MTPSTRPTGPSTAATPAGSSTAASPRRRGRPRSGWFRAENEALAGPAPPLTSRNSVRLGLRANWRQFALLVLINAFVGGVVGVERSTLAPLGEHDFQVVSRTAILSFLISFGLVKAGSNLAAGWLADRFGRRMILVAGWIAALPVAPLIIFAPSWSWVVAANVLLGINQGLAWSMTVNMKIDLVGPRRRGFALGLNEASGYVSVSLAAAAAGFLAASFGRRLTSLPKAWPSRDSCCLCSRGRPPDTWSWNQRVMTHRDRWLRLSSRSAFATGACRAPARQAWSTT